MARFTAIPRLTVGAAALMVLSALLAVVPSKVENVGIYPEFDKVGVNLEYVRKASADGSGRR